MIGRIIEEMIEDFFLKELSDFAPFFSEEDVVSNLHRKLINTVEPPDRIFGEFPVVSAAPVRITETKYNHIPNEFRNHYHREGKYFELNNIFELPNFNNHVNFEAKYIDLVFTSKYDTSNLEDRMISPDIVLEMKYEVDSNRRNINSNDRIRRNISLPKNSIASIRYDILSLLQYSYINTGKISYFVFIDEGMHFLNRNAFNNMISEVQRINKDNVKIDFLSKEALKSVFIMKFVRNI